LANEDFTTYTEVDQNNQITVDSSTRISTISDSAPGQAYVYDDFGIDYFDSDWSFQFEIFFEDNLLCYYSALTNQNNKSANAQDNFDTIAVYETNFYIQSKRLAAYTSDIFIKTNSVLYFVTFERNGSTLTAYVRTGSHTGTLVDTLVIAPSKINWRYLNPTIGHSEIHFHVGYIQNLDLGLSIEYTITPLDSVCDFVSSLIIATIVYPRLSRKVFSANPACFLCGTKKIAYTLDANTNEG